jgi:hypothetical protein
MTREPHPNTRDPANARTDAGRWNSFEQELQSRSKRDWDGSERQGAKEKAIARVC